jgi:hypothetical protein
MLLLMLELANATEVGKGKVFGIGATTGYPAIAVTGKYYLNQKTGIAAFLGTTVFYHQLQVEYQSEFLEIHDWDFARFPIYWFAGLDLGLTSLVNGSLDFTLYPKIGVIGGVGVALQFHDVPAEVFVESGLGIYPLNGCDGFYYAACLPGVMGHAGGRWYF